MILKCIMHHKKLPTPCAHICTLDAFLTFKPLENQWVPLLMHAGPISGSVGFKKCQYTTHIARQEEHIKTTTKK